MSAIAAHYAPSSSSSSSAAASDRRLLARPPPSVRPTTRPPFFHDAYVLVLAEHRPASPLDAGYSSLTHSAATAGPSYSWDAHQSAVQSPSYSASSSSPASANAYSASSTAATAGHSSVTASFSSYASHSDAYPLQHSHRPSFPSSRPHHPSSSHLSSSSATASNDHHWDSSGLYTIDPVEPVTHSPSHHAYTHSTASSTPATPLTPPIKEEEQEGEFIIEVSVPADPVPSSMPEVPLRATHAPPAQRKRMYSFRLESFAMHDGIRSAATAPGSGGIRAGPLSEPPIEFEWQAHLLVPLIPDEEIAQGHRFSSHTPRSHGGYSVDSPTMSPRGTERTSPRRTRTTDAHAAAGSASPTLSLDYPSGLENDAWDGSSSGYASVADNGSAGGTASTGSPTFAPIMTPAQSLGWSLRYGTGEAEPKQSSYYRQPAAQPSLSRVSQPQTRYLLGDPASPKQSYHSHSSTYAQQSTHQQQYGYDTGGGYSRSSGHGGGTSGRYSGSYF
ncbi:hypothetical protein BN946_scf184473.g7 [Trametes cinnabarina]|uniref:Uncharacterized protein n=1 Tax=Pycnoporus cinnabarinus TaxID=5643 RepID=A0A060SX10_PYCCI|nr:hypothetical protein BN946_scf184473.g7 [Trametes cinnabarina]